MNIEDHLGTVTFNETWKEATNPEFAPTIPAPAEFQEEPESAPSLGVEPVRIATTSEIAQLMHGLHPAVPDAIYHERVRGLASKSSLDIIQRSPSHYLAWANGQEGESTAALDFGAAFHRALLEPTVFAEEFVTAPEFGDCRVKVNKEAKAAWLAVNGSKKELSAQDRERIMGMVAAVRAHPLAGRMISDGEPELTLRWRDPASGVECKGRLDYFVRKHSMGLDVKSSIDASAAEFAKSAARYGYHRQEALYRSGMSIIGSPLRHFVFVVVEKAAPYAVAIYSLEDSDVQKGAVSIAADLQTLARCMREDSWPGYAPGIQTLSLPKWAA